MSMQDPVADMLTRIRNAQMAEKKDVTMPSSSIIVISQFEVTRIGGIPPEEYTFP